MEIIFISFFFFFFSVPVLLRDHSWEFQESALPHAVLALPPLLSGLIVLREGERNHASMRPHLHPELGCAMLHSCSSYAFHPASLCETRGFYVEPEDCCFLQRKLLLLENLLAPVGNLCSSLSSQHATAAFDTLMGLTGVILSREPWLGTYHLLHICI